LLQIAQYFYNGKMAEDTSEKSNIAIHNVSRRDFLKISGASVLTLILNACTRKLGLPSSTLTPTQAPAEPAPIRSTDIPPTTEIGVKSVNSISFRGDSIMLINNGQSPDKSVFLRGLYYTPGPDNNPESWEKLNDAGINLVSQCFPTKNNVDQAEQHDVYLTPFLPNIVQNGEIDVSSLARLEESKAVIGIYGADEPALTKDLYMSTLKQAEKLDPNQPTFPTFAEYFTFLDNQPFDTTDFKANYPGNPADLAGLPDTITHDQFVAWYMRESGCEIASFDYYDNFDDSGALDMQKVVAIGDITDRYVKNLRSGNFGPNAKAVAVTLSAHSEYPKLTRQIMNYQALTVISHDASIIQWWDWPYGCSAESCQGYPGKGYGYSVHWNDLQSITRQLDSAKDGLTGQKMFLGNNPSGNVAYKVTESQNGTWYVFSAFNHATPGRTPREIISGLLPNTSFQVMGENRTVKTDENGNLADNFGPLDARIYVQS
jgi:hypothetical protein